MGEYYWQHSGTTNRFKGGHSLDDRASEAFYSVRLTETTSVANGEAESVVSKSKSIRSLCVWVALVHSGCRKAPQIKYVTGRRRRGAGKMRLRRLVRARWMPILSMCKKKTEYTRLAIWSNASTSFNRYALRYIE